MLGGDLSWANDYKHVISSLTNDTIRVEVIFPMSKLESVRTEEATKRFEADIEKLQTAGAQVYYTDGNFKLRCTIIDIDGDDNDDMKVISSKRIDVHEREILKNTYRVHFFRNNKSDGSHEKIYCNLYRDSYELIKHHRQPYPEKEQQKVTAR